MSPPEVRSPEPVPLRPGHERGSLPPWLWVALLAAVVAVLLALFVRT